MPKGVVGFGVLGCAGIAEKTCQGIAETASARVVAVGSRALAKAEAFVQAHAPGATPYGSYEAVLEDSRVQVVYIPLPTTMKKEWVLKAAQKKKHVLCEKPLAADIKDVEAMLAACREAGVQFMDNTMFMHNERLGKMRAVLDDRDLFGEVKHVMSSFSIPFGNDPAWAAGNIRMAQALEPLGSLGDLGWYNIRLSLWAFAWEDPTEVSCVYLDTTEEGLPITLHAVMRFARGRSAAFDCSFRCALRQWAEVVGEKCTLTLDDLCVTQEHGKASFAVARGSISEKALTFPKETVKSETLVGCVQHVALIEALSALVRGGEPDPKWPAWTLQTQRILLLLHDSARQGGAWLQVQRSDGPGRP